MRRDEKTLLYPIKNIQRTQNLREKQTIKTPIADRQETGSPLLKHFKMNYKSNLFWLGILFGFGLYKIISIAWSYAWITSIAQNTNASTINLIETKTGTDNNKQPLSDVKNAVQTCNQILKKGKIHSYSWAMNNKKIFILPYQQ